MVGKKALSSYGNHPYPPIYVARGHINIIMTKIERPAGYSHICLSMIVTYNMTSHGPEAREKWFCCKFTQARDISALGNSRGQTVHVISMHMTHVVQKASNYYNYAVIVAVGE